MAGKQLNYYRILGVSRKATDDEIHDTFRRLARKYHPDVNPGDKKAEEKFKAITEAYEVLSDSDKRRRYDTLGSDWNAPAGAGPPPRRRPPFGFARAAQPYDAASTGKERGGVGGFFRSLFGRSAGSGPAEEASRQPLDIEADVTISLEQAFRGGSTAVALRVPERAGGGGRMTTRKYDIKIPPGIRDGARIRLAGQGHPNAERRGAPGDLYIRVHIAPHPTFRLRESDVESDLAVSPWEAALGAKISAPTLEGSVELTLPAGSQAGQRLRLRGKGMPLPNDTRGDHFLVVKIVIPEHLSARERELWEQLARESSFNPRR
jgi:curved DNA-binding protein